MAKKNKKNKIKLVQKKIKSINRRVQAKTVEISRNQERVITAILILAQTRATMYTPRDTNALINSQYRTITKNDLGRVVGRVGYTQEYAFFLHGNKSITPNWKPKPPNSPGKKGGGYNPNATPHFLARGFKEESENIKRVIIEKNRL